MSKRAEVLCCHIINGILAKELQSQCIPQHAHQFSLHTAGAYVH